MKKKGLLFVAAMLTTLALTSCVNDSEVAGDDNQAKNTTRSVVFNISLPNGDPVVYTRTAQTADEATVNKLYMYEFDAATEKLIAKADLSTEASAVLGGSTYTWTYTSTADYTHGTQSRFVFIANDDKAETLTVNTSTLSDLMALEASQTLTDNSVDLWKEFSSSKFLPMTGVAKTASGSVIIPMDETSNVAVSVDLTRIVARIDVVNKTPGLQITDMKLVKANDKSYLMPHTTSGAVTLVSGISQKSSGFMAANVTLPSNGTAAGAELKSAFYVYEDDAPTAEADALHLQVTGKLNSSIDVFYNIPFTGASYATPDATDFFEINRNYLYTVTIGDGNAANVNTNVKATVNVVEWTKQNVTETFDTDIFTCDDTNYNRSTQKVTGVAATSASNVVIKVADAYKGAVTITGIEVLTADGWSAVSETTATADWLTASMDATNGTVTLMSGNNATGTVRTGSVRITYTASGTTGLKKVFTIVQNAA